MKRARPRRLTHSWASLLPRVSAESCKLQGMTHSNNHDSSRYIGRPMKRREDPRLLTGTGRYVDDLAPAGCLHVAFARSPHAHARIARLDVDSARRAPGVMMIVLGEDVA